MKTNVYKLSLIKEKAVDYSYREFRLNNPKAVVELMDKVYDIGNLPEEHVWCIAVDAKMHILGLFEVSHGSINWSSASPKDIFKRVLLCGGLGFFMVHNHPSGDIHPSQEDTLITRRMKECGELLEVKLYDHIIIGENDYYSYSEEGQL